MTMLPIRALTCAAIAACATTPAAAQAIYGPEAARCGAGGGPAILVSIVGLKNHAGTVRVRTFGGAPSTWFSKDKWLKRVEFATPASGPIRVCMPVSAPGTYAVDLRHDVNGNGDSDRADGGGASGDPRLTLWDFVFKRKPSPSITAVRVGQGVTEITVTAMYLSGTSVKPIREHR